MSAEDVRSVGVIGAGRFGAELALVFARAGLDVVLVDVTAAALERACAQNQKACAVMTQTGLMRPGDADGILGRVRTTARLDDVRPIDFGIEAIPDGLEAKQQLFQSLESICREDVYFGCTSQSIGGLDPAEMMATMAHPERVIRMHWLQPAFLIPAVEIVDDGRVSAEAIAFMQALLTRIGQKAIVVRDVPGLVLNRFQHLLYTEALAMVEQGIASLEDVDAAFRYGLSMRFPLWGILGTHDRVASKDGTLAAAERLRAATGETKYGPSPLLREKVERRETGIWSGKGWYDYDGQSLEELISDRDRKLSRMVALLEAEGFL